MFAEELTNAAKDKWRSYVDPQVEELKAKCTELAQKGECSFVWDLTAWKKEMEKQCELTEEIHRAIVEKAKSLGLIVTPSNFSTSYNYVCDVSWPKPNLCSEQKSK
jgi:hypothetical protein